VKELTPSDTLKWFHVGPSLTAFVFNNIGAFQRATTFVFSNIPASQQAAESSSFVFIDIPESFL
jgi:hypothetical protein